MVTIYDNDDHDGDGDGDSDGIHHHDNVDGRKHHHRRQQREQCPAPAEPGLTAANITFTIWNEKHEHTRKRRHRLAYDSQHLCFQNRCFSSCSYTEVPGRVLSVVQC